MAGAGAVDSTYAAPDLPRIVVTEDGRRMRLVDEETISYFLSRPLQPPTMRAYYSAELMRFMGLDEEKVDTLLRASENEQAVRRIHVDVLRQYEAWGYAYLEIPALYPVDDMEEQETMERLN